VPVVTPAPIRPHGECLQALTRIAIQESDQLVVANEIELVNPVLAHERPKRELTSFAVGAPLRESD